MDREVEWGGSVCAFGDESLEGDLHGKRVLSLAHATPGVMVGASPAVIGRTLGQARGLLARHATKQVDRLLSHPAIDPWEVAARSDAMGWIGGNCSSFSVTGVVIALGTRRVASTELVEI